MIISKGVGKYAEKSTYNGRCKRDYPIRAIFVCLFWSTLGRSGSPFEPSIFLLLINFYCLLLMKHRFYYYYLLIVNYY